LDLDSAGQPCWLWSGLLQEKVDVRAPTRLDIVSRTYPWRVVCPA